MINNIKNYLSKDTDSYILWLPVFFAIGILLQFSFYSKFIYFGLVLFILLICFLFKRFNYFILLILFLLFGYLRSYIFIKNNEHDRIKEPLGYVKIYGEVKEEITKKNYKDELIKEIIVKTNKIDNENRNILLKIRLKDPNIKVYKSNIILKSVVFPIKNNPMGFNIERYYYFKHIGGLGYKGEIIYNEKTNNKEKSINTIRKDIAERIIKVREETSSTGIISILITGKKDMADKKAIEYMNYSGLAHLLSISGLHMMTLIGIMFFISKWILLRFEYIALNYNVFKISSIISLLINFLYLLLSGASVSAVRAYLMSVILLVSIIIGKFNTSLRSVMFVMFVVLLVKPNLIFSAGFQMSFMAVIALISCSELLYNDVLSKLSKTKRFLIIGFLTSFIAECSTTPFSIYNFNNYSFYNIFVNSFLTPLVSFIVLPFSLLSMLLYPFNLEKILILPASYIMDFILYVSKYIVELPYSVFFIQSPNIYSMLFMILGLLWFCLWKEKWRYYGILFYIIGLFIFFFQKTPDVLITNNSVFMINNKTAYVYTKNKYEVFTITKKLGLKKYKIINYNFKDCNKEYCIKIIKENDNITYIKNGKLIKIKKLEIVSNFKLIYKIK